MENFKSIARKKGRGERGKKRGGERRGREGEKEGGREGEGAESSEEERDYHKQVREARLTFSSRTPDIRKAAVVLLMPHDIVCTRGRGTRGSVPQS